MKKILLLTLMIGCTLANAAPFYTINSDTVVVKKNGKVITEKQISDENSATIRVGKDLITLHRKEGKTVFDILPKKDKDKKRWRHFDGHWEGFEIGTNMFMDGNQEIISSGSWEVLTPRSLELNFNIYQSELAVTSRVGFITGVGLSYNDYRFANDITIDKIDGQIQVVPLAEEDYPDLKKSKFSMIYLNIPLLLEFQLPHKRHTYLSFGIEGGLKLKEHTKIKYGKKKDKDYGSFNVNPLRYTGVVRLGIGDIRLFGRYSFSRLFKGSADPELHPFTVGISFN